MVPRTVLSVVLLEHFVSLCFAGIPVIGLLHDPKRGVGLGFSTSVIIGICFPIFFSGFLLFVAAQG